MACEEEGTSYSLETLTNVALSALIKVGIAVAFTSNCVESIAGLYGIYRSDAQLGARHEV